MIMPNDPSIPSNGRFDQLQAMIANFDMPDNLRGDIKWIDSNLHLFPFTKKEMKIAENLLDYLMFRKRPANS